MTSLSLSSLSFSFNDQILIEFQNLRIKTEEMYAMEIFDKENVM